jgi:hypothetical protein
MRADSEEVAVTVASPSASPPVKTHLDGHLYEELSRLAVENDRSLAAEVRRAIREYVERAVEERS